MKRELWIIIILMMISCGNISSLFSTIPTQAKTPSPVTLPIYTAPIVVATPAPSLTGKPNTPSLSATPSPTSTPPQIYPTLSSTVYPPILPGSPAGCIKYWNPHDGIGKGFLAKTGESTKRLTVIFPTTLTSNGKFVSVTTWNGAKKIEILKYREALTEDKSNRPIYDSEISLSKYPVQIVTNADGNCYKFNPHQRVD